MPHLSKRQIENLVLGSLRLLNEEKQDDKKIPVASGTVLLGTGTQLDSLDFVVVITDIEERLQNAIGSEFELAVEMQSEDGSNPFRSVESLCEHIAAILEQESASG